MKQVIIAYIPALHEGYIRFLQKYPEAELCLMTTDVIKALSKETPYFGRDVRAIDPELMVKIINSMKIVSKAVLLDEETIRRCQKAEALEIIMPTEDISLAFYRQYLPDQKVLFQSFFLRWDKLISQKEVEVSPDRKITVQEMDRELMGHAKNEAEKASDWWRQVGCVLVKDGSIILYCHNKHMPHEQSAYVLGDPRHNFNAGERIDLSLALHAEAGVIAEAAKRGKATEDSSIYVTTFPCPGCARQIAASGIRKVYYKDGYSLLDAEDILKTAKVDLILVKME